MGWKYEVTQWVRHTDQGPYHWEDVYAGDSLIRAVLAAVRAKRESGCVKLEWR